MYPNLGPDCSERDARIVRRAYWRKGVYIYVAIKLFVIGFGVALVALGVEFAIYFQGREAWPSGIFLGVIFAWAVRAYFKYLEAEHERNLDD